MSEDTENELAKFSDAVILKEYVRIRELKEAATSEYKKQDAKFKAKIDKLNLELLSRMQKRGNEGFRTEYGSAYVEEDFKPSAADWSTIYDWAVMDQERLNMFEKRLSKTFVVNYMKEHGSIDEKTGETTLGNPPPGVNIHREFIARVRK
jgi:hypothetical protein